MPLIVGDEDAAVANTAYLDDRMQAGKTIWYPQGDIYFDGTANTASKQNCTRWKTYTSRGYSQVPHPTLGCIGTRLIQLANAPLVNIVGAGFYCTDPVEIVGPGVNSGVPAITMESRTAPAVGHHVFQDMIFRDWDGAFHILATPDEQHGDNSYVLRCHSANLKWFWKSECQQAQIWYFDRCFVMAEGLTVDFDYTFIDAIKGGKVYVDGLEVLWPRFNLFQVTEFSPNQCRFSCRNLSLDRMVYEGAFCKALKYAGTQQDITSKKWFVDVEGFVSQYFGTAPDCYLDVPGNLPLDYVNIDIKTLYTN